MPIIKEPKVIKQRRQRTSVVGSKAPWDIDSPRALAKELGVGSGSSEIYKLHAMWSQDVGIDSKYECASFVKKEWDQGLSEYLANEFEKGMNKRGQELSCQILLEHYSTTIYLFKKYQVNHDEYLATINKIDWDDVKLTPTQEIDRLKAKVNKINALNKKAGIRMKEILDENKRLKTKEDRFTKIAPALAKCVHKLAPTVKIHDVTDYIHGLIYRKDIWGLPDYMKNILPENDVSDPNMSPHDISDAINRSCSSGPRSSLDKMVDGDYDG